MRSRGRLTVACLAVALVFLAACDDDSPVVLPPPPSGSDRPVAELSVGVWGSRTELAAYQKVIDAFNSRTDEADATLKTYPSRTALVAALVAAKHDRTADAPDIFLTSRADLATLQEDDLITPLDELLDERGVDLGDGYSRTSIEAFSADRRLQCMPYGISPMVVYYNTDLVDFSRMQARGLPVPDSPSRWTLGEFSAAASFASRPRRGTKGVYVSPTLDGLSPFIYSGGGDPYDDDVSPTSLAFSDGGTRDALQRTLPLLRDPTVTLSEAQLSAHPAVWWFEHGKLGMITAGRGLVPALRRTKGLHFDVIPMPFLDHIATVGDVTGLCLSSATTDQSEATDLLVHMISSESISDVVRTGYLVPANQLVALSDRFTQPLREPLHAAAFTYSVKYLQLTPLLDDAAALEAAVSAGLEQLIGSGPALDLDLITNEIDDESRTVLDPDGDGTPGTAPTPTDSPSDDASDDASDGASPDASNDAG